MAENAGISFIFDFSGDHLALDFANTVSSRHTDRPVERLPDYGQLVSFARQAGLVSDEEAARLERWAERHRREADATVAAAREYREAGYRVFKAVAEARPPDDGDLAVLNQWIARMRVGRALDWEWCDGPRAPDALMLPIVRASLDLLRSAERDRVHVCGADDCFWLFFDTSKNRSRRWCDMKSCGNRMKARRFQARKGDREGPAEPTPS